MALAEQGIGGKGTRHEQGAEVDKHRRREGEAAAEWAARLAVVDRSKMSAYDMKLLARWKTDAEQLAQEESEQAGEGLATSSPTRRVPSLAQAPPADAAPPRSPSSGAPLSALDRIKEAIRGLEDADRARLVLWVAGGMRD